MAAAAAAGEMPDVSSLDETHIPGLMKQNLLKPIPDYVIDVKKEMGQRVADFYKIPPGPNYYSLPNGCMSGCSMFVNEEVLTKKGMKLSQIPKTWDEFIKFAKDMTVYKGNEISEWGFTFMGCQQITDLAMYQKGSFFYKNNKTSMFGDPLNVEAYQWVLDLFDKHKLDFRAAPLNPQDRVGQGLAAIGYQWSWATGFMVTTYPNVKWAQIPVPTFTGKPVYGRSSDDLGFAVTTQSKDQDVTDAAWITYRYLVGPDYQRRYVVLRGLAPSLLALKKEKQFQPDNMQYNGIGVATTPGNFRTDGHWTPEATTMMWQEPWDRVFTKNEKPEVVLKDQEAKITKYLADWNLPMLFGKDGWKADWEKPEA
jgi:multiple sugar transport system substrate-binding protein